VVLCRHVEVAGGRWLSIHRHLNLACLNQQRLVPAEANHHLELSKARSGEGTKGADHKDNKTS